MDLLRIAVRIEHLHPIDGLRALMQKSIKADDTLADAVRKKRYNTFMSPDSIRKLQRIANVEFKLSTYRKCEGTAKQQLTALRSSGFNGIQAADRELQYVGNLASQTRGKLARAELQWLIDDLRGEAAKAINHWKSQLEQAKSNGNRTEMELAATWLGGMILRDMLAELGVSAKEPQPAVAPELQNPESGQTPEQPGATTSVLDESDLELHDELSPSMQVHLEERLRAHQEVVQLRRENGELRIAAVKLKEEIRELKACIADARLGKNDAHKEAEAQVRAVNMREARRMFLR